MPHAPVSITRYSLLAIAAWLCAACSSNPATRPDEPQPGPLAHDITFASSSPSDYIITGTSCTITLTLLRENGDSAPEQTVSINVRADRGSAKAPPSLLFEAGSATAVLKIDYSHDALAPNAADIITVNADEVSHRVTIRRSAGEKSAATYTRSFIHTPVSVTIDDGTYIVEGPGISRRISLVDGTPYVHGGDGITDISDARDIVAQRNTWVPYAYSTPSSYDQAEGRFNLAVADSDLVPTIEYLSLDSDSEWADCGTSTFIDRWALPIISINAALLDPDKHPWRVWAQQSTTQPGLYRVVDPYRGDSPLALYNDAPAGTIMTIDATNPGKVSIHPAKTLFTNPASPPSQSMAQAGWAVARLPTQSSSTTAPYSSSATKIKTGAYPCGIRAACMVVGVLFECFFHSIIGNHLLLEGVSACLGRLHHLDNLAVGAAFTLLEGCDGFLCHISVVFI